MAIRNIALGVTLATILGGTSGDASSKEIRFKVKYSGTAMSTYADTNGDGIRAGMGLVTGQSNIGPYRSQGVGEAKVEGPATCRNGNAGINLVLIPGTGHTVTSFDRTQDLVFGELTSETVCYDPATNTQFKSGTTKITGGTGRFAGATGVSEFEGTQWPLYVDASGNGFAAQIGTARGTIVLRDDPPARLPRLER